MHDAQVLAAALADDALPVDLTEDALALEFTRRHRDELRYVHEWGKWLRWDGARWATGAGRSGVYDLARALTRAGRPRHPQPQGPGEGSRRLYGRRDRHARPRRPCPCPGDGGLRRGPLAAKHARRHRGPPDGRAARPPPGGRHHQGHARSRRRTEAPKLWLRCLDTWTMGDPDLVAFLQRLTGYFLTGSHQGRGASHRPRAGGNGKPSSLRRTRGLGNDYVTGVSMETLIVTKRGAAPDRRGRPPGQPSGHRHRDRGGAPPGRGQG